MYDCIVIGGGHNGLVCAAYLARARRSVLVLEAAEQVGGAAVTREFSPGFKVSACAHLLHLMPGSLMRELGLDARGLRMAAAHLPTTAIAPEQLPLALDTGNGSELASCCAADAAAYPSFQQRLQRLGAALQPMLEATPPRLGTDSWQDRWSWLRLGWRLRRLGRRDMRELLRIGGMCVQDLLDEQFETPLLKGALGFDAVLGANLGPRSPGSVLPLLYRTAAEVRSVSALAQPIGGIGAVSQALAAAVLAAGGQIRTGTLVDRILIDDDRASGVVLASGEQLQARQVISNADPKTTFLKLLGSEHLDAGFVRRITNLRAGGVTAKLHLALDRLPQFSGVAPQRLLGRLLLAPSLDYIERAFNHAKYGEFSAQPIIEVTVPSVSDPALAPAGKHVLSALVQYVPYQLVGGWQHERARFTQLVIETLEQCAPGLRAGIEAAELLTPADIERQFRISGGHWHHAELALDQFFMVRPVPGAAQYRTPMSGLYLCGAGCHPGGGVMGVAGRNAARELLREAA
ncbi:MAG TPA: NAD(P)/FAD-dependent oxidoreductase [Steroidobacteraceae bacterium]|jgi:phytoene dehydrogenase-like protein